MIIYNNYLVTISTKNKFIIPSNYTLHPTYNNCHTDSDLSEEASIVNQIYFSINNRSLTTFGMTKVLNKLTISSRNKKTFKENKGKNKILCVTDERQKVLYKFKNENNY